MKTTTPKSDQLSTKKSQVLKSGMVPPKTSARSGQRNGNAVIGEKHNPRKTKILLDVTPDLIILHQKFSELLLAGIPSAAPLFSDADSK